MAMEKNLLFHFSRGIRSKSDGQVRWTPPVRMTVHREGRNNHHYLHLPGNVKVIALDDDNDDVP